MKQVTRVSLDHCLRADVRWFKTKDDETVLWRAKAGSESWAVRVNDFPEEHLYTLFVGNQEIGSFDEWPRQWVRS